MFMCHEDYILYTKYLEYHSILNAVHEGFGYTDFLIFFKANFIDNIYEYIPTIFFYEIVVYICIYD